jgi:FkbM family methyltransferase
MCTGLLAAARAAHMLYPFSHFRTASLISRLNGASPLKLRRRLFGYKLALEANRSNAHVVLYLVGERFAQDDTLILEEHLKPGMVAYDVGANIGYLALYLCSRVGPTGAVFAFEPEPDNFRELETNVRGNAIPFCYPLQMAVGAAEGVVSINSGLNGTIAGTAEQGCPMVSIDAFCRSNPEPDFVKIDVEGYELHVLHGMQRLLERRRPILHVEVHPTGFCGQGDPPAVYEFLRSRYTQIEAYIPLHESLDSWGKVLRNRLQSRTRMLTACRVPVEDVVQRPERRYFLLCTSSL